MSLEVKTPFDRITAQRLKCGDRVLINGKIYTARDAAHKRMIETLEKGGALPIDIESHHI